MRLSVPTPTDDPLPLAQAREDMPAPADLPLRGAAVAQFDALLHELNPDAVRVDPERVQATVRLAGHRCRRAPPRTCSIAACAGSRNCARCSTTPTGMPTTRPACGCAS